MNEGISLFLKIQLGLPGLFTSLRLLQWRCSDPCSCSELLQMGYKDANVVRSAGPKGKNCQ